MTESASPSSTAPPDPAEPGGFTDAVIRFVQVWGVPIGMTLAYVALMWTSDTDVTGKAWMAIGLGFVFVIWYVFRLLTQDAALARAISVGDAPRIVELSTRYLATHRGAAARAPYLVAQGIAHELRGEPSLALAALDQAKLEALPAKARELWRLRAAATRIAALAAQGEVGPAREVLERELAPDAAHPAHSDAYLIANLSAGRVLAAEGQATAAAARLRKVTDDIRATSAMRAAAQAVLARTAVSPAR